MAMGGLRRRALWRTIPYLRPYRRHMAVIVISALVSTVAYVALPLIVKHVIDGPLEQGDRGAIVRWSVLAIALACVEMGLAFIRPPLRPHSAQRGNKEPSITLQCRAVGERRTIMGARSAQ